MDKIKKRDGRIVPFDRNKIEQAIGKAFIATGTSFEAHTFSDLTNLVVEQLEEKFIEKISGVEDVQDVVEQTLAGAEYFAVAKSYIIYRKEHHKIREDRKKEIVEKVEKRKINVTKRNGKIEKFNIKEIERAVKNCAKKYPELDADIKGILQDIKTGIYENITTSEINQVVLMAIKARIENDPLYSSLAAKFLINDLYKEVIGVDEFEQEFENKYRKRFIEHIHYGIEDKRIDPRLKEFDLEKLSNKLVLERDGLFEYIGAQTLSDRYFLRDHKQQIVETPQSFWMRVAMGLALGESKQVALWAKAEERTNWAIKFYEILSELRYVPSSPTLLHSGTQLPQMSSCYLTTVVDDLHHIFKCIGDNAQLSKWSGGIGQDWTDVRATNALIKTINVPSQGVIPFLKIVDSTTAAINRSGKRRGATCVYLEAWHMDFEHFIDLRKNTGDDRRRTHDTNTAGWVPDLLVKRVKSGGDWTFFSSEEVPELHHIYGKKFEEKYIEYERKADEGKIKLWKRIPARDLWRKMITSLYETGHPWITFKDPCNIRSPQDHAGVVHSSNLCTEITLNTSREETAVCNLGSVKLPRHVHKGKINWGLLSESVELAMRMLDNVIDINFYPTPEAENSNKAHRPVGLGVMGFQDLLFELGIPFESDEAVALSDELMEFISYNAILTSSILAKERGTYSSYKGSKWDRNIFPIDSLEMLEQERGMEIKTREGGETLDWSKARNHVEEYGMRNSNCMAIAPTATLANITGCLPSIEPIYKNLYVKSNFSGDFTIINKYLVRDLRELGLWNSELIEKIKYYEGNISRINEIPEDVRKKYKEVFEIHPSWIIRHASARGKWIDQSQSINIFTSSESGKFVSDVYLDAWESGLKTTYYLRTLGASAIEKSTIDINKDYEHMANGKEQIATDKNFVPVLASAKIVSIAEDGICESCE